MNHKDTIATLNISRYSKNALHELEDQVGMESEQVFQLPDGRELRLACTALHLEELALGVNFSQTAASKDIPDTPVSETSGVPAEDWMPVSYEKLLECYHVFSHASPIFRATGSVHSGQLMDENYNILFFTEDMGRHNVIEKIIGFGLKNKVSLDGKILMISSRMPIELIGKAHRAGIRTIASVSAPTMQAVRYAREHRINLVGMFRENRFNVYSKK